MAVRVRVEFTGRVGRVLGCVALLNGGFESLRPTVLLPAAAAVHVLARPLAKARRIRVEVACGETSLWTVQEHLMGCVVTRDRRGRAIRFHVLVAEGEREVLVSDSAIDALGVEIKSFGKGLWRFRRQRRLRRSEDPQRW